MKMAFDPNRSTPPTDGYRWARASGGHIPPGAVPHGYEQDGTPLWVCRAHMYGGLHPGKVRPALGMAGIAWDGEELGVPDYEVLMDRGVWGIAHGGEVPADAYQVGWESSGEPLYTARAAVDGSNLQLGKLRREFGAANIGYGNSEHKIHAYEVLLHPAPRY
ncbi:hypothetical protein Acsp01_83360 [Actinoplanes sp. NBRC 101535]|nr:hypothetical protein Acsp01_83360 [Actinoplanes sp. NBRC 101535]